MDITLALGGGGARGNAHIGVIRRLEKEGFRIKAVTGTSAGGIIAAMYAAGYSPDDMENIFSEVDQSRLFGRSPHEGPSLLGLAGVTKWLEEWLGRRTFAELQIPCAVTAVDLKTGRELILRQGRVVDAVLATIALPGVFPPRQYKEYSLIDGAVLDPVPVTTARAFAPALPVVAVVLTPTTSAQGQLTKLPLPVSIPAPIVRRITRMRVAQAFNIFLQAVDIGGRMLTELRLRMDNPEVIIRPMVGNVGLLERVDIHALARAGEQAVEKALPDLRRVVTWTNRLRRRLFRRDRR